MLRRALVAIVLFEIAFIAAAGTGLSVFRDLSAVVFNIGFALWLGMEAARVRLGHNNNAKTFGTFSRIFLIVSFACVFVAVWERGNGYPIFAEPLPAASVYIGVGLFIVGIYLRHLSIKQLGKYFVTKVQITDDHELVTTGLYARIRHPSYTGLILGFLGAILFLQAPLAVVIFVMLGVLAYIYRIKVEEQVLLRTFGRQYESYMRRTCALIPYIY